MNSCKLPWETCGRRPSHSSNGREAAAAETQGRQHHSRSSRTGRRASVVKAVREAEGADDRTSTAVEQTLLDQPTELAVGLGLKVPGGADFSTTATPQGCSRFTSNQTWVPRSRMVRCGTRRWGHHRPVNRSLTPTLTVLAPAILLSIKRLPPIDRGRRRTSWTVG